MPRPRCERCGGRLYSDESQLGHELSGRCTAREPKPETGARSPSRFQSDFSVGARNPRAWGAGAKPGTKYNTAEPPHGTHKRYASRKWRCHCELCRKGEAQYAAQRRQARRAAQTVAR